MTQINGLKSSKTHGLDHYCVQMKDVVSAHLEDWFQHTLESNCNQSYFGINPN